MTNNKFQSLGDRIDAIKRKILSWLRSRTDCVYALKSMRDHIRFALGNHNGKSLTDVQKKDASNFIQELAKMFGITPVERKNDDKIIVWHLLMPQT